jgi:hypothetical protein
MYMYSEGAETGEEEIVLVTQSDFLLTREGVGVVGWGGGGLVPDQRGGGGRGEASH